MTAAAGMPGELNELVALDRFELPSRQRPPASALDRWMRYLGFPIGIAAFLWVYYLPTPGGADVRAVRIGRAPPAR